jgi:hypothetical protein
MPKVIVEVIDQGGLKVSRIVRITTSFALGCMTALVGASFAFAQDGTSRPYNAGGQMLEKVIKEYNQTGKQMRIEGSCQSSCTKLLGVRNVCIDPSATLLFHAWNNPEGQALMLAKYNSKLRNYLVKNGYVATRNFHSISGRDMIQQFGYRACK